MKHINADTIEQLVENALPHLAYELPADISYAYKIASQCETNPLAKEALCQLCTNDEIARTNQVPVCQDTGSVRVLLQIGPDVSVTGDVFSKVDNAVAKAYKIAKLRKSMVKDAILNRDNTQDNTPAFCEIETVDKPGFANLKIMIKGGGSDNASRVVMLAPGDGEKGLIENIVKCVKEKAASACAPIVLGIGIGSTFDKVGSLAHKALFRPLGQENPNSKLANLENQILNEVNKTSVGAAGLGGQITALQVNIISSQTHIASMPLAIDMGCCALRRLSIDVPCGENIGFGKIDNAINQAINKPKKYFDQIEKNIKTICKDTNINNTKNSDAIKINLPLKKEDAIKLKAGDKCLLSGPIFTLRDAGHLRLLEELKRKEHLPYNLEGQTIYYAGPTPSIDNQPFGAIGPTTSSRMDFATPTLYDKGLAATIGKGKRNKAVHDSCIKNKTLFFVAVGGSAAYLAKCVKSSKDIAYEDLGTEALRKLEVKDFPVFVGIDTQGNDIYK